ncbi:hydantoinase/oxoprolinase family protein [Candidatus Poribacteria bacterium]|nr:hydantoinase/oxoprolinase family protein [Candidatus Poribacteria bacterium]
MNSSDHRKGNTKNTRLIGVDTGGTFTDIVLSEGTTLTTHKVMSTPENPAHAVITGVNEICNMASEKDLSEIQIIHGSTVAINALLERKGARIALITTKGFEDVLEIGRQARSNLYDLYVERPKPLIPFNLRFGINERTLYTGEIKYEIKNEELNSLSEQLFKFDLDAIAICFLFSYVNPQNEQLAAEYLTKHNIPISCSHQILPEYREFARFSTTVASAYVRPTLEKHLKTLHVSNRFPPSLSLMLSNGGRVSSKNIESTGIQTLLSGPAGGVIGAFHIAKTAGYHKIITFDMGGTSTDVSLCNDDVSLTTESIINGIPIKVPLIDIHTVGAGGGSIAFLDSGGALRVGPESAGADPGPICYDQGGENITVTDANLYLRRISPQHFLDGNMSLSTDRTNRMIEEFSKRINISPLKTAEGILQIANSIMVNAIKVISVERGYDCKDFTLVSFGGAGGLHAAFLADSLGIQTILIPPNGGLLSAYGMLYADVIKDYSQTVLMQISTGQEYTNHSIIEKLDKCYKELEQKAIYEMELEGFELSQLKMLRSLDIRYLGQSYELNVPCSHDTLDFVDSFHSIHKKRYSYSHPDAKIEIVNLRLSALYETEKPDIDSNPLTDKQPSSALIGEKDVVFNNKLHATRFYRREELLPGNRIDGPAIITEYSATSVVPPSFSINIDTYKNIILRQK